MACAPRGPLRVTVLNAFAPMLGTSLAPWGCRERTDSSMP